MTFGAENIRNSKFQTPLHSGSRRVSALNHFLCRVMAEKLAVGQDSRYGFQNPTGVARTGINSTCQANNIFKTYIPY